MDLRYSSQFKPLPAFKWLLAILVLLGTDTAWATSWWQCAWQHRSEVTIQSTTSVTDKAIPIELTSANFSTDYAFTPDGADLRVLDTDDATELDFHLESWDATSRSALLHVRVPNLSANVARTIYIYYGNVDETAGVSAVPGESSPTNTYIESGWRFHIKSSTLDPSNEAQARAEFDIASEPFGYGCAVVDELLNLNKRSVFGGDRVDFALFAETLFEVTSPGIWNFRLGADYGRGGAVYIDGTPLTERWNEDLWWARDYNHPEVLSGSVFLSAGIHRFETLGFEGCCDGPLSAQYQPPGSSVWREFSDDNINLYTAGCPVGSQSVSYVRTDTPNQFAGIAFLDNGDSADAHNGSQEGNETGLAGVNVSVAVVNISASQTVTTGADGSWNTCLLNEAIGNDVQVSLPVPENHFSVSENVSAPNSDTALNAVIQFPVLANNNYLDITTGFIPYPQLLSDNTMDVGAGLTGLLPHRYIPGSNANVSFQIAQLQHEPAGVYHYAAYEDQDCDGSVDSPAVLLTSSVAAQAGKDICFVIQVDGTPATTISSNLTLQIDVTSAFSGINLSHINTNTDNVNGADPIALLVNKSVCNATTDSCNLNTGNGFSINNVGEPNDELIYRLEFLSLLGTVHNVSVYDAVPTHTRLKPSSMSVVSQPAGMSCTISEPANQNITDFTGIVKWECIGNANISEKGVVAFSVLID